MIGDVTLPDPDRIKQLLRDLDDPDRLEMPADFHYGREHRRFAALVAGLERKFDCSCQVDAGRHVQDASFLGQVVVPAPATSMGHAIFVRVSNFGGLTLVGVDGPGIHTDAETVKLISASDLTAVFALLRNRGYEPLLEDVLNRPYDGVNDSLQEAYSRHPATWFIRFFDYI